MKDFEWLWEYARCAGCTHFCKGNNGEWICMAWDKEIHDITDNECEAMKAEEKEGR